MVKNEARIQRMKGLRIMLNEISLEVPLLVGYYIWKGRWTKEKEP